MSSNHFNQMASNQDFKENIQENQNEVDIIIENVVCSFNVRSHLDLRKIARSGTNVEYRKENHRQSYTYKVLQTVIFAQLKEIRLKLRTFGFLQAH